MKSNLAQQATADNFVDFLVGDVVVFEHEYQPHCLMTVESIHDDGYFIKVHEYSLAFRFKDLRHASAMELNANRRLTEAEQALAEVS